jgi:hypothetical protein
MDSGHSSATSTEAMDPKYLPLPLVARVIPMTR